MQPRAFMRYGTAALALLTPLGLITTGSTPVAAAADGSASWQKYLRTPASDVVAPVRVLSTTGNVANAAALTGGAGEATLTMTAGGPRPRIVLDYGQEVGGTPYFETSAVLPGAGASSVAMRSAFSESQQYLFTGGAATLARPATAGATTVLVDSVANFVVGDPMTIGSGAAAQTVTITAVGRAATATTLSTASAAGATNLKVASVGSLTVGDTITVDTGAGAETATVAAVGTPAGSTTLSAAAAAGAASITVRSGTPFTAGDTITVGAATATVASVNGTTLTLTAPLATAQASGATVTTPGTGITLAAPLAAAHASGAAVSAPGTGVTFAQKLTVAHAAAEAVASTPGTATGDWPSASTGVDVPVSGAGTTTAALQGGFRYQVIELDSPGTVKLDDAEITFGAYRATADKYQGHFESSSPALNQLYYDGAYTVQMNMVPAGVGGSTVPQLFDGAKRDRRIWSGDLLAENSTIANTLGTNGYPYIKADLQYLIDNQDAAGQLASVGSFRYYSLSYSIDTALAVIQYYRYSADTAFANRSLAALKKEMDYLTANLDSRGLVVTSASNGRDWAFDDGAHAGVDTYYNVLYYRLLTEMAYYVDQLGDTGLAATYTAQAATLRTTINDVLFNPATGAYKFLESQPDVIPQDANVAAVLWGVAPADKVQGILDVVKNKLWSTNGSTPYTDNAGFRKVMSPYINGFETAARFENGRQGEAMELMDRMWGNMSRSPLYNGTFWEELMYDGSLWMGGHDSLAHGWSSGPTWQSSEYVLGAQPVDPGYKTWTVKPHTAGLTWANGTVPTAYATPLGVDWSTNAARHQFQLHLEAPAGTSGTVSVPVEAGNVVTVDGQTVWNGTTGTQYGARLQDGYVVLNGVTGTHDVVAQPKTAPAPTPAAATTKVKVKAPKVHQVAGKETVNLRAAVKAATASHGKAGKLVVRIDGRKVDTFRVAVTTRGKVEDIGKIRAQLARGKHHLRLAFKPNDAKAYEASTSRNVTFTVTE